MSKPTAQKADAEKAKKTPFEEALDKQFGEGFSEMEAESKRNHVHDFTCECGETPEALEISSKESPELSKKFWREQAIALKKELDSSKEKLAAVRKKVAKRLNQWTAISDNPSDIKTRELVRLYTTADDIAEAQADAVVLELQEVLQVIDEAEAAATEAERETK